MKAAKTQQVIETLDDLLAQVQKGEEVIIHDSHGQAMAVLSSPPPARVPGLDAGTIRIADDFNAPLPDDASGELEDAR